MAGKMEELSAELDDLAASLLESKRESGGGLSDDEDMASQLSRSFEAEDWGSIADILKSLENTSQGKSRLSPQHHRLTPLSENIQCSVPPTPPLSPTGVKDGGQGMQQLDHLLRMMEQMCALQKQNSKLREQAEYLTAIKNLQELRNETLLENCHCGSHHRSMDSCGGVRFEPLHMPEETLSEPESQIGDDINSGRQRERRNSRARSIKRDLSKRNMKNRSRSADPFSDDKEKDGSRERGRVGIFSKFEKMKEKLTTRRGSVKNHPTKRGIYDDAHRRMELSMDGSSIHMDGGTLETKSEDSGIYHVDPAELMQKSQEDFSDSEEVFSTPPMAPSAWSKPPVFSSAEGRKNSDFSTGSSSEDYLELKPKRQSRGVDYEGSVVYRRRRKDLSPHRLKNGDYDDENRHKVIRRSASFQDNISLSDDDYEDAKSQWEVKEAPAIMQGHVALHESRSIPLMDSTSRHGQPYQRTESDDLRAAHKRKHFHRVQHIDDVDLACNGDQRPYSVDFPLKNSPPEKKRPKGWEKVKHAVSRKHGMPEAGYKKGFSEFYTELSAEDHEALAAAEGAILMDRGLGSEERISRPQKRYRESCGQSTSGQSGGSTATSNTSLAMYENLQASLSDDFTKKMEKWDRKKIRKGGQLDKTKQTSFDSASSDATSPAISSPAVLDELQKNLSDDFTKKMLEWDRKKQGKPYANPPQVPQKPGVKAKQKRPGSKMIKNKAGNVRGRESPQNKRRSQSPEGRNIAPYSTEEIYSEKNVALFEREAVELHLEGVSKEFNKRYKEWERIKKLNTKQDEDFEQQMKIKENEVLVDPKDSRRVAIIEQHKSMTSDTDVYLVGNAAPVIVEPEFERYKSHEAGSQAEFADKAKRELAASLGDDSVFGDSAPSESGDGQLGAGLNRLEQRNSLLAEQLRHKDVNLQAVSDELHNMQEQIDRITGEKHEMRRVSVCSSLGESALEAELIDIKSQIQHIEEQFEKYPPHRRSRDEVKGHRRRSKFRGDGQVKKVDESTSTDAQPEKIEAEVQTHTPEEKQSDTDETDNKDLGSPTTQLKKCLHEREAIIKLLQAEVDRQANELNYLKNGDAAGTFRRAKSFSARDRKTFDLRAMRVVDISLDKNDKLEDLAEKADEMPELPTRRLDEFPVTHREKSDTLSSRSSQDSKRESIMSIQSSSTTQSLEALHISAEDIRMEESGGSEASDKPRSIRSFASDSSSQETKSEPIRKVSLPVSLDRRPDRRERESSPESATSLLRKRCNRDNIEILPSRKDMSSRVDVKGEDLKDKEDGVIPASPSRLRKVSSPHVEAVKHGEKPQSNSAETSPKSPRRLVNVNHSSHSSFAHIARKFDSGSVKGSSESLGSKDGKSLVQERKEMFAVRGKLEKSASLDSSQITGSRAKSADVGKRKDSTDSTSARRAVSQWVDKHDPILSKSVKKPEDKSVNNLRKKFVTLEYGGGSAPNVSEVGHQSLKDKYTPRGRREAPKQGCVRQLSQAFSMVSLMDNDQQRRGSTSSSVKSSPRSLSPASSTNSLIANQIKKLQDKAGDATDATTGSTSDVSTSRRPSVELNKPNSRENSPLPVSPLVGRRDRQSLPNIAAVRAKFDKSNDKSATATDSANDSKDDSKSDNKPARTKSTPTNRITYKVSVVNDNDKEKSPATSNRNSKSTEVAVRVKSPRLVAVIESPPEKEQEDGTVTFTLKPNPSKACKLNSLPQQVKDRSLKNSAGNVRRKTAMFTATVEETTTVIKKPVVEDKKEEKKKTDNKSDKKEVKIEVKAVATKARETKASSTVRPKEITNKSSPTTRSSPARNRTSTAKPLADDKSSEREESARTRRRRREQTANSLSPTTEQSKVIDRSTGTVYSSGKSPDRRGRRSRNRRDLKTPTSQDVEQKKSESEKQDRLARGARRERERREANTRTEMTEAQRKEAIIARRERREAREARESARVERKDSKKETIYETIEYKDTKNTKGNKNEKKDSSKSKRESVKIDRKDSKSKKDGRLQRTESDKKETDSPLRSLRRRRSKKDDLGSPELDSTSEGASGNSELDSTSQSSDYPDLLANTRRRKDSTKSSDNRSSRCARAVVAHSALKGAEALIGTQLPKTSEDDTNERKSQKDKSRRGRAINRADRISRLDLFRRARSVDSSKATKDRSPSHERGKSDRAQSVDRSSKKRDSSIDRHKDGKNWLSKRTGSITNFLRASNQSLTDSLESSDGASIHGNNNKSWNHAEDCPDNCHHDSGFHENNVLHIGSTSDESVDWHNDDSMYESEEDSNKHDSS